MSLHSLYVNTDLSNEMLLLRLLYYFHCLSALLVFAFFCNYVFLIKDSHAAICLEVAEFLAVCVTCLVLLKVLFFSLFGVNGNMKDSDVSVPNHCFFLFALRLDISFHIYFHLFCLP